MNKVDKDTLIKLLIITVIVLGYLYFFNNDCKELKKEIEEMTVEGNDNIDEGEEGENCPPSPNNDPNFSDWVPQDNSCQCWEGTESTSITNSSGERVKRCAPSQTTTEEGEGTTTEGGEGTTTEEGEGTTTEGGEGTTTEEGEGTTTQGPGRCIPNTLLYSCNKWNSLMDPQIRSCATHTNRDSCEYEKVHGPGGDPPDPNADPPYRGFIIPEGAGTNPSICEYSDRCPAEYSEWRNDPERVNPPTNTNTNTNTQEPSEELLAAREAASAAEEAALAAAEAADQAAALAEENQGDVDAIAAAEAAAAVAVEAQAEATRLREEEESITQNETNVNVNVNDSINNAITQGQEIQRRTLELDIPTDVINQISGDLGNALSSGDNERSLMEARNLVNRLEYLINVGDDGAEDILARRNRIQDLLAQIDTLNTQLQAEGVEFNNINNANQAVIRSATDNTQQENFANFENSQGDGMVTYTNYALLQ